MPHINFTYDVLQKLRDTVEKTPEGKAVKFHRDWMLQVVEGLEIFRVSAVNTALECVEREGEAEGLSRQIDRAEAAHAADLNTVRDWLEHLDESNYFNALARVRAVSQHLRTTLLIGKADE
jgi:hypothetical protein